MDYWKKMVNDNAAVPLHKCVCELGIAWSDIGMMESVCESLVWLEQLSMWGSRV